MSKIIPFDYGDNLIRVVNDEETGEPLWIAKDVCNVLGLENVNRALSKLDEDEKLKLKILTSGQNRETMCVSESGLYNLIFRSNKPEAKPFKRWVTHEVLPSIRKTGGYGVAQNGADLSPVLAEIMSGLVEMNRTMQTIVETMQQMQSRVAATELHIRYMGDTQKDVKEVMKSTYNYLKYMPLTREEKIKLNMRIQKRGKELSDMHNITLENAVASVYRALNKAYSLSSYHDLDRKDFLSAYDFVEYVDISKHSEYYKSDIQDPMERKYGEDKTGGSRGRTIYGDIPNIVIYSD